MGYATSHGTRIGRSPSGEGGRKSAPSLVRSLALAVFCAVACLSPGAHPAGAETVVFKSGKTIEARVKDLGDRIRIEPTDGGPAFTFPKSSIRRIEKSDPKPQSTPAPGPAAVRERPRLSIHIISDNPEGDEKLRGELDDIMPRLMRIFDDTFGLEHRNDLNLQLRIFETPREFRAYQVRYSRRISSQTGVYFRSQNLAVIQRRDPFSTRHTSIHELFHGVVDTRYSQCPHWLNEGLATYFQGAFAFDHRIVVQPYRSLDIRLKTLLERDSLPSLRRFLRLSVRDWSLQDENNKTVAYAIGWSLVYFLMSSEEGKSTLGRMLDVLHEGDNLVPLFQIPEIDRAYPGGFKKLEEDWRTWIAAPRVPHVYPSEAD